MCGFFASNDPTVSKKNAALVDEVLRFRGPDMQSGLLEFCGWRIYHARLAIIAPTPEFSQPFTCEDGSMLLFNGEIFNYRELSAMHLGAALDSDTATLAKLLLLPGFDIADLEGFFAFVHISASGELLRCARDHFGVKPLFVYRRKEFISISSEPRALKELFNLRHTASAISEYRIFRGPIFSGSYFHGVDQIEAGTCLVRGRYFESLDLVQCADYVSVDIEEIRNTIDAAVASRHIADVPVGLLFSGGVDSNLIDAEGPRLIRYCVGFKGDYDLEYAEKLNDGREIRTLHVDAEAFRHKFESLLALRGEPMSVPNEVMLSLIGDAAKHDGVKVLLSGEGADEFFAGYDRIYTWAANTQVFSVLEFCKRYCYGQIGEKDDEFSKLNEIFQSFGDISPFELVRQFFVKYHLPLLFRRLDFSLMSAGIEGREPLAAVSLFKLAARLGPIHLMQNGLGKIPLRELLASTRGHEFAYRPKVGFPVQLNKIFQSERMDRMSNYDVWFEKNMEVFQ